MGDLPFFILAVLFVGTAAYHLLLYSRFQLYRRRRQQTERLWFGLLALCFAANTFASCFWVYQVTGRYDVAIRASDLTGHLAAMLALQFLWTFFSRPISRPLRAYQLSHGVLALLIALWPDARMVAASQSFRSLWLLPLLAMAVALIAREAWRGDEEARTLAAGGLVLVAAVAVELAGQVFPGIPEGWRSPVSLPPFGFAALLAAMSFSLSSRFRRVHDELDRLRLNLEEKVRERTLALQEAKEEALAASRAKSEFLANMSHEISKRLVELMGGRIWVESTAGQGSTFYFTITGELASVPLRPPALASSADRGLARRHPLRILLAEDHPVNRKVMLCLLEHLGYQADLATDGPEALEALERQPYDVVLMDVQMPELDGLAATRRIRGELPEDRQPWIIALTAHAMSGDRERCLEAGMDAYLGKPVQIAELAAALAAASPRDRHAQEGGGEALDPETLDRLRDLPGGESLVRTLIPTFLATSAADFASLRREVEESRWWDVGRTAHRLKGSSAALGLLQVAAACCAIEERIRAERTDELSPLVTRLEEEIGRAGAALETRVLETRVEKGA